MSVESDEVRKRSMELLNAALELPEPERAAFLDEACDGTTLRREVEILLRSAEEDSDFMERPVFNVHARDAEAGRSIGPYRLVRLLGRGGMGAVYLAVRDDDFEKRVALKLVKRGMDTDEIVRRFENERRILAGLEHPYIARLVDGGTTPDGLPWFAMDYVEGEPIHEYCDVRRLDLDERLALFRKVCSAVHLAHQSLVVHRDLKPANILVTGDGEPRLLDFGIAKLLEPDPLFRTVVTMSGLRPMTPACASPEQIRGGPVTTAADTYALGVLLYQLIAGHSPHGPGSRDEAELARRICEEEPERPSAVVRRTVDVYRLDGSVVRITPESVSGRRNCEPGALRRRLAGDLDAIVLKALRKEPRHRYGSVEQFSEDVRRHLEGRPVTARKGTIPYRAGKFLRRHRLGLAALLVIVIFALTTVTLWQQAARAERALLRENEAERLTDFMVELFRASTPNRAKGEVLTARQLLDEGRKTIGDLEDEPRAYATLTSVLGRVYGDLGLYDLARPLLEESVRVRRELYPEGPLLLADSLHYLAMVSYNLGDHDAAVALFREALALRQDRLDERDEDVLSARGSLAVLLEDRGKYEEAEEMYRRILEIRREVHGPRHWRVAKVLNNLGAVLYSRGDHEHAEEILREALSIRLEVRGPEHTEVADTLNNLGRVEQARGKLVEAEGRFREALEIQRKRSGEGHVETAMTERNLAWLLASEGDGEEASELARHALEVFREVYPEGHWRIADAESVLGGCLAAQGLYEEAEPLLAASYRVLSEVKGASSPYTRQAKRRYLELDTARGSPQGERRLPVDL